MEFYRLVIRAHPQLSTLSRAFFVTPSSKPKEYFENVNFEEKNHCTINDIFRKLCTLAKIMTILDEPLQH